MVSTSVASESTDSVCMWSICCDTNAVSYFSALAADKSRCNGSVLAKFSLAAILESCCSLAVNGVIFYFNFNSF